MSELAGQYKNQLRESSLTISRILQLGAEYMSLRLFERKAKRILESGVSFQSYLPAPGPFLAQLEVSPRPYGGRFEAKVVEVFPDESEEVYSLDGSLNSYDYGNSGWHITLNRTLWDSSGQPQTVSTYDSHAEETKNSVARTEVGNLLDFLHAQQLIQAGTLD